MVIQSQISKPKFDNIAELLNKHVPEEYRCYIREFVEFLYELYEVWRSSPGELKKKYAYHMALLQADSDSANVIRAKINAFYAYLAFKRIVPPYRLIKSRVVAGGESIYTWLRMYRTLLSGH